MAPLALARWGLPGEGAAPVFIPGARFPLAGLLLVLPALEGTGLLEAARQVYGRLKDGFYGLTATLLTLVWGPAAVLVCGPTWISMVR